MILEIAILNIQPGQNEAFEQAFAEARHIIASMKGYRGHELRQCIEHDNRYLLQVQWEQLADHTEGFRNSPEYQRWRQLLHHYYDPFPEVLHFHEALPGDVGRD